MPTVGWQWGGTLDYFDPIYGTHGDVHLKEAITYGGTIVMPVRPGYSGEIEYWYQSTELVARPNGVSGELNEHKLFDMAVHYIQISGVRDLREEGDRVTPYIMGGFGTTVFDPGNTPYGNFSSRWQFSMNAGGGLRIQISDRMAWRLQSRVLLPTAWVGGSAWFGSGGGGYTWSAQVIPQGEAMFGIQYKLGE
jgi:opacity protein-like surface antigen